MSGRTPKQINRQSEQPPIPPEPIKPAPHPKYVRDIEEFTSFLADRGKAFAEATAADAQEFVKTVLLGQYAVTTIARKLSELRTTYGCCPVIANPFNHIRVEVPAKLRKSTASSVTETAAALERIKVVSAKCVRDQALIALVSFDQLGTSQLQRLDLGELSLASGMAWVSARGDRRREVYLSRESLPYLRRWLALREQYAVATPAVFISLHWTAGRAAPHGRMSARAIYEVRAFYARRPS